MRFLHLATFYPPYSFGGDAMYVYRLAHTLAELGHEVDVVHNVDAFHLQHPADPKIAFAEHPGVRRHELRSGWGKLGLLATHQSGRPLAHQQQIQEVFRSKPYDVVHYHNVSLLGPDVLRYEVAGGRAVKMYTTHEHWLVCPMHVLWKFNERACEKPECLECVLRGNRPPQIWRSTGFLKHCAHHVDRFVSPSRFTARMHAERGFSQPVEHLPYFIPRADADWQQPQPPPQDKPLGQLTQAQLGAVYHHAIAVIVPSLTYETFGMILIEAFARKTPAIARNLGALPEVIQDAQAGFVYDDEKGLLEAVGKMGADRATRDAMGERGYTAFERWWTPEAHLRLYSAFLRDTARAKLSTSPLHEWHTTSSPAGPDLSARTLPKP
ncbi:MAG: glycosyltransferase family 4 protein [Bryobacterales bacterium]|nr:glycosyltransferase family 4 protein [Bryobacterales bacterium]